VIDRKAVLELDDKADRLTPDMDLALFGFRVDEDEFRRMLGVNLGAVVAPTKAGAQACPWQERAGAGGKRMKSLGSRFRGNDELKLPQAQPPIS
jgi:hypothetical protein